MATSVKQRKRSWVEEEGAPRSSFLLEQSLPKPRISVYSGKALTGRAAAAEGGNADLDEAVDDEESSGKGEAYSEEEASAGEEGSGEEEASDEEEASGEEEASDGEEGPGGDIAPGVGEVAGEGASTDEPIFMVLSDPDVLDCPTCFLPLGIPVYQCANGHTSCLSCNTKLNNKCPSCSVQMGNIRNRALERIIQSTEVFCHYNSHGCQAKFSYKNLSSHEDFCIHAPFACPFRACNFRGSLKRLSLHLCHSHDGVIQFRFNAAFSVTLLRDDEMVVLNEQRYRVPFILRCVNKTIKIGCFGSFRSEDSRFEYGVVVRKGGSYQLFHSPTEKAVGRDEDPPSSDFLQVPGYLFDSGGGLTLRVCIWKDSASVDVSRFLNGENVETRARNSILDFDW